MRAGDGQDVVGEQVRGRMYQDLYDTLVWTPGHEQWQHNPHHSPDSSEDCYGQQGGTHGALKQHTHEVRWRGS